MGVLDSRSFARFLSRALAISACLIAPPAIAGEETSEPTAAQLEQFEKQVRPLLIQHCHRCHGDAAESKGGLRLLSRQDLLSGGDSGAAIVPGDAEASLLVQAVRYSPDSYQMPPSGQLSDAEIATIVEWVAAGAPWPADKTATSEQPAAHKAAFNLPERKTDHWAWQPIREAAIPEVAQPNWPRGPIDRFILARLEAAGLAPASEADRAVLLRRITFDLIGLPPTPADIDAFLADTSPDAYDRVVERLLASPHYGERWGRHWLDLVRYAESHGHEFDYDLENAWQYRDYVIRAFNADVPYDQFVIEHIAGDLLEAPRRHPSEGLNESVIGTGFFHFGEAVHSPVDIRGDEADRIDNQIDVLCKTFLGLTVTCARCHDHKFDAISTKDYYGLVGFLRSSHFQQAYLDAPQQNAAVVTELQELATQRRAAAVDVVKSSVLPAIERLPKLLLAAREVLADTQGAPEERIARAAERHALGTTSLAAWVAYLPTAAQNPADPWHPWSVLTGDPNLTSPEQFSAAGHALAARLATAGTTSGELFEAFSEPSFGRWKPTGDAFVTGPTTGGEIFFGTDPNAPVQRVLAAGIAHTGRESGHLRGALRSESFTIAHKRIAYRAAGRGQIRLVVDSHRVIFGPLHGGLNLKVESDDQLQWHVQNVEEYQGHRAHIELIDESDQYLAVDEIRFSDGEMPRDPANASIILLLEQAHLGSAEQLASEYQKVFAKAFETGFASYSSSAGDRELLNWTLAHPALFERSAASAEALAHTTSFAAQQQALEARLRQARRAPALADGSGENMAVHIRGNHKQLGEVVERRFLEALGGVEHPIDVPGSGRLELALQMTSPQNPLLARVIVNRLWLHHFGEGLVPSPDDFGKMGQPPTHPELLEYLAAELPRLGWSLKALHRQMVLSATYRMSSRPSPEALAKDPQNKLLQHMRVRRLEAEGVRDSVLAVSGRLDRRQFGPSVPVYLTEYMVGRGRPAHSGPLDGAARRSLYLAVRRNFMTPLLMAFDFPQPSTTIGRRNVSNVPAQGLALMNDPFVVEQAAHWAELGLAGQNEPAKRIEAFYRQAFGRSPATSELAAATEFVLAQRQRYAGSPSDSSAGSANADAERRAWNDLCHALLGAKEFLFVE